mmetsp:Transcript_48402/g.128177  ORF Transcript_48402/g.128177 Transcript_48402/m.128177 type:complete len:244 (+) Transcript_48402:214-945(+)
MVTKSRSPLRAQPVKKANTALSESVFCKKATSCVMPSSDTASLRARHRTSAWPYCFLGLFCSTSLSSFRDQNAVSRVTNRTSLVFSRSGLITSTASSRSSASLWPTTTQARRSVQRCGQDLSVSIFAILTAMRGLTFFTKDSASRTPPSSTVFGFSPLVMKNESGGDSRSLKRCATLRPLSVGSQQPRIATLMSATLRNSRVCSSRIPGKRYFRVSLLTQYTSHGSPLKSTSLSRGVSATSMS